MKANGQLENTNPTDWIKAIATAMGSIETLAERNENWAEEYRDYAADEARHLAKDINRTFSNENLGNPEAVAQQDIARAARRIEEYKQDAEKREVIAGALRTALEILRASTGEYHYAFYSGWYGDSAWRFQTAEARDAWVAEKNAGGFDGYHAATEADLRKIINGQVDVKDPAEK